MFRFVTSETGLFILCDHQHCRKSLFGKLPPGMPEQHAIVAFMAHAAQQGWQTRLYGHYCPEHHDDTKVEAASPIILASQVPGVAKMVPRRLEL